MQTNVSKTSTVGIIVPSIRELSIKNFFDQWKKYFSNTLHKLTVYLIEDNESRTFLLNNDYSFRIKHYSWKEIDELLGKDSWIIPRRTDAIRSFGIYMAYQDNCDYFITMDDDCYPFNDPLTYKCSFIEDHLRNLTDLEIEEVRWTNTLINYRPRGYPYGETSVSKHYANIAINHGLWVNVPDFDAITSLSLKKKESYYDHTVDQVIPANKFYPMCSMNLSWRREVTPLMYFLLMGQNNKGKQFGFDRFGDIWCGLIAQKIMRKLDLLSASGRPYVFHDRASNPFVNLNKESPGILVNEKLWKDLDTIDIKSTTLIKMYKEISIKLPRYGEYWDQLSRAMLIWINLF